MKTRIISALLALPVVMSLIYLGGWPFGLLVLIATGVCLYEFGAMTIPGDRPAQVLIVVLGLVTLMGVFTGAFAAPRSVALFALLPGLWMTFLLFRTGDIQTVAARSGYGLLAVAWPGTMLAATGCLRFLPNGDAWFLLACVLAWGSDTGAYFVGRWIGKHRLYEKVSPNKTWEGAVGGVVVATAGAFVLQHFLKAPGIPTWAMLLLAPLATAFGQLGDLAESLLKRSTGVKDSGKILPGHGGLLDRLDALMFVGPVLLLYALWAAGAEVTWLGWPGSS